MAAPFFLAMPTMAGAFAYDLYKNRDAGAVAPNATVSALLHPYRRVWV